MVGIDTPESSKKRYGYAECYGEEAKQHLKDLTKYKPPYAKYFIEVDESQ
jgi:endonuclease YncB( thermonuclease family)